VRDAVLGVGYPASRIHFVEGAVEDTLPDRAPGEIALLRLDTDWYASTKHELEHLYPRLVAGGVLILDDYGYWQGARRAVDEYFAAKGEPLLLNRIDGTARIAIRP
jgi:O-methyltransferase